MTKQIRAVWLRFWYKHSGDAGTDEFHAQVNHEKKPVAKKAPVESATDRQIRELREQLESQQTQINALKQQLVDRDASLNATSQQVQSANARAAAATARRRAVSSSVQANTEAVSDADFDGGRPEDAQAPVWLRRSATPRKT